MQAWEKVQNRSPNYLVMQSLVGRDVDMTSSQAQYLLARLECELATRVPSIRPPRMGTYVIAANPATLNYLIRRYDPFQGRA